MNPKFTNPNFPYLPIHIQVGIFQKKIDLDLEVLIDTGFDGGIAIPKSFTDLSTLPFVKQTWKLADSTEISVPVYAGYVQIDKLDPVMTIIIVLGDEPLIGRQVLNHFKVILDHGKKIIVEV